MDSVALVVNCYERTYRDVIRPGFFPQVETANGRAFDEVVVLINNVDDRTDAEGRAQGLLRGGEITGHYFVADCLPVAIRHSGLSTRAFARRPFLLDYGLVMPHVVTSEFLLGWDAETILERPCNWIDPSIRLLRSRRDVLTAGLNWFPAVEGEDELEGETVAKAGDFSLNFGFSDQVFLIKREDMLTVRWRSFAPAALVRHAPHPYTFEFRMESYQRASNRMRATLRTLRYRSNTIAGGVIRRTSPSLVDGLQLRLLRAFEHRLVNHIPRSAGPRFSK